MKLLKKLLAVLVADDPRQAVDLGNGGDSLAILDQLGGSLQNSEARSRAAWCLLT